MESFFAEQARLIRTVGAKKRYLYDAIDRDLRCVGILGARGTGKTTLMLQMVKEHSAGGSDRALYVSIDSPYFQAHDLFEFGQKQHEPVFINIKIICIKRLLTGRALSKNCLAVKLTRLTK